MPTQHGRWHLDYYLVELVIQNPSPESIWLSLWLYGLIKVYRLKYLKVALNFITSPPPQKDVILFLIYYFGQGLWFQRISLGLYHYNSSYSIGQAPNRKHCSKCQICQSQLYIQSIENWPTSGSVEAVRLDFSQAFMFHMTRMPPF